MSFGDFWGFWVSLTDESGVRQARKEFFPPNTQPGPTGIQNDFGYGRTRSHFRIPVVT